MVTSLVEIMALVNSVNGFIAVGRRNTAVDLLTAGSARGWLATKRKFRAHLERVTLRCSEARAGGGNPILSQGFQLPIIRLDHW